MLPPAKYSMTLPMTEAGTLSAAARMTEGNEGVDMARC
jgi:hypothetical protein